MGASHASKGGRRWRYYVSRAALTGRKQDAGSVVRVPASEIEDRVARAVGTHLAVQARVINGGNHAITQQGDERGDNAALKSSIELYKRALEDLTRERVPLDWAATQTNLGAALERLGERESGNAAVLVLRTSNTLICHARAA